MASQATIPPVVDHVKRSTIHEIAHKSPFNIFNIVAIVAILVIGYFMYKKFNQKFAQGAIRLSQPLPAVVKREAAPVVVETVPNKPEVIPEPGVKEE